MYDKEQIEQDRRFEMTLNGQPDIAISRMDEAMGNLEFNLLNRYFGALGIEDAYADDEVTKLSKEWEFLGQSATLSGYIWIAEDVSDNPRPLPKAFGQPLEYDEDGCAKHKVHGVPMLSDGLALIIGKVDGEDGGIGSIRLAYDFLLPLAGDDTRYITAYPDELTRHSYEIVSFAAAQQNLETAFPQEYSQLREALADGRRDQFPAVVSELVAKIQQDAIPELLQSLEVFLTRSLSKNGPYRISIINSLGVVAASEKPDEIDTLDSQQNLWTTLRVSGVLSDIVDAPECQFEQKKGTQPALTMTAQRLPYGDGDAETIKVLWENITVLQSQRSVGSLGKQALLHDGMIKGATSRYMNKQHKAEATGPTGAILSLEQGPLVAEPPEVLRMALYEKTIYEIVDIVKAHARQAYLSAAQAHEACQYLINTEIFPMLSKLASATRAEIVVSGEVSVPRVEINEEEDEQYITTTIRTDKMKPVVELDVGDSWTGRMAGVKPGTRVLKGAAGDGSDAYTILPQLKLTRPSHASQEHAMGLFSNYHTSAALVSLDGSAEIRVAELDAYRAIQIALADAKEAYGKRCHDLLEQLRVASSAKAANSAPAATNPAALQHLAAAIGELGDEGSSSVMVRALEAIVLHRLMKIDGDRLGFDGAQLERRAEEVPGISEVAMRIVDVRGDLDDTQGIHLVVQYLYDDAPRLDYIPIASIRSFEF